MRRRRSQKAPLSAFGQPSHPLAISLYVAQRSESLLFSVCLCVCVHVCKGEARSYIYTYVCTHMHFVEAICMYVRTHVYVCDCKAGYTLHMHTILECVRM